MPKAMRPDFKKELGHMAVNPFTKEKLVLETLMEFVLFDEANVARLDQGWDGLKQMCGSLRFIDTLRSTRESS